MTGFARFVAVAAALTLPGVAQAATVTVYNSIQLNTALQRARAGDTIQVAPGNYGALEIKNLNPSSAINIVSSNSANRPVFSSIKISDSSNLKLTRLIASGSTPTAANPIQYTTTVSRSHDIRLSGMVFRGVLGGGVSNEPRGMRLSQSTNITVASNSFTELSHAILTDGSSRLNISDNGFTGIRTDGIISDGATSSVIARNRFAEFRPGVGDHPDAIQLFNGGAGTLNLTISDNLIIGAATGQMQGIFLENDSGIRSQLDQIKVASNLLWGTMWNGIAASTGNRVAVTSNRLYSNPLLAIQKTWVRLEDVTSATSTGNFAGAYIFGGLGSLAQSGNILSVSDALARAAVAQWDATHLAAQFSLPYRDATTLMSGRMMGLSASDTGYRSDVAIAAIPEPANWLMMIGGFAMIGGLGPRLQRPAWRRMARG